MTAAEENPDAGLWGPALAVLQEWDPSWARACRAMSVHPIRQGVLSERFAALICIGLAASCTTLNAEATRRHIRAALDFGATREQILFVIKCATVVSLHSLSVAAPLLAAESEMPAPQSSTPIPARDAMRAAGQWNAAWDPFADLDPDWTEQFMALGADLYTSGVLAPKEIELLSIAIDASVTHLYAPGIRRHIRGARHAGASTAEITAVLQLCVSQGVQACNLAVPILHDELELTD